MKRSTLAILLVAIASLAWATEYKPLTGSYRVAGKTLYDPPPDEPSDTHVYFELSGSAARDLYRAMKAKPRRDACGEPGELAKTVGEMHCTRSARGSEYRCWFGVDIAKQRLTRAVVC